MGRAVGGEGDRLDGRFWVEVSQMGEVNWDQGVGESH